MPAADSMHQQILEIATSGRGMVDITDRLRRAIDDSGVQTGLAHLFIRHTSASLLINENADPDVQRDLETFLSDLAPDGDPRYVHTAEGPDDMPAHVRHMLTATELSIPVRDGRPALGTWQGVFVWEHRHRPHRREVVVTVTG